MYLVNGQIFETAEALHAAIEVIRRCYLPGDLLTGDDLDFMIDVLAMHPNATSLMEAGTHIGLTFDREQRRKVFMVYRADGTLENFDYQVCIAEPTINAWFVYHCRQALRPGLEAYQQAFFRTDSHSVVCPQSGDRIAPETSFVDYIPPQTFRTLLEPFIHDCEVNVYREINRKILNQWIDYHWQRAKLQVVSQAIYGRIGKGENLQYCETITHGMQARRQGYRDELIVQQYSLLVEGI